MKKSLVHTIVSSIVGMVLMVVACVFFVMAFVSSLQMVSSEYFTKEIICNVLKYICIGGIASVVSMVAFLSDVFKSLSLLEKHIADEQGKDR